MSVPIRAKIKPDVPTSDLWQIAESGDIGELDAQDETFDTVSDPDVAPTSSNKEVRTLHDPPEIWDMVHETRTEFDPRSAFVTHLTSVSPLVLTAIALIIGGAVLFWFVKLSGRSGTSPAAPSARTENSNTRSASSSQVAVPNRTELPPTQPATNTPVSTAVAGSRVEPNIAVTALTALSAKRVVARPPGRNQKSSVTSGSAAVAVTYNKDKAQESMFAGPKSDTEKRADPTVAKKESAKTPGPQLIAPAKGNPTPRAKVIQWP